MHHRLREQIVQFEQQASKILAGNLIASLMLVFLINPVVNTSAILFWLGLQTLFNLIRFLLTLKNRKTVLQTEHQIQSRYQHYIHMVIASALIWGLSAFLLFPASAVEYQLLYFLIIVGFTSTAMSLINTLPRAYPILLLIIFACVFIKLATITTQFSISLGLVLSIFIVLMLSAAQSFRRNLIESIVLRMELQQQAIHDALTGIYNRRYFMDQLQAEWNRCMRHQRPISIVLIDIDHFKKLNDQYGHQKGDECLVALAELLNKSIHRTGEFVARIGGEEFAIVIPNETTTAASKLAEKLRTDISLLKFNHKQNSFYVSVSLGIACTTPKMGSDCDALISAADQALYQANADGRNCYRISSIRCDDSE